MEVRYAFIKKEVLEDLVSLRMLVKEDIVFIVFIPKVFLILEVSNGILYPWIVYTSYLSLMCGNKRLENDVDLEDK